MKHFITLLAGLLITAPVIGLTLEGKTLTFTDEDIAVCVAGGGCRLITDKQIAQLLKADDCRSKI
jgi:hypothetical protein